MNFFLEKIRNKLGNNLLHEMQMMGVSTVVSSLLSMFSVKCFGSITSDFRKYFESRKYSDIFVIISQIQTIPNFGNHSELSESLGNFRNHSEISEFFYTWRAIRRPGHFIYTLVKPAETGYLSNQITGLLSLLQSAEDWIVEYLTSCDIYTNTLHLSTRLM